MRICKKCGCEVIDDELKYCSRCGADLSKKENVVEGSIGKEKETGEYTIEDFKPHKRKICFLLQFLLGFTGASFFYLGYIGRGFAWIGVNILVVIVAFITKIPFLLIAVFIINFAVALGWLYKKDLIDKNGNDLL